MIVDLHKPIKVDKATAWRTYTGGSLIETLHGSANAEDSHFPEEWIMSTVAARNSGREDIIEGLSMVSGTDISLDELIKSNPALILGEKHYSKYGATTGVLVKLIDAAERLTIQVHPTREKAKELFGSPFGKTECWHILGGRNINGEKPCIYFGFKPGITRRKWMDIFDKQDIAAMLSCLHRFEVDAGDTFLIEGGVPHAIGAGCFLVELQEPTDYTIRPERVTPNGLKVDDFMCHQGLGFERMFDCFEYRGYTKQETAERWKILRDKKDIIGYDKTTMFRMEEIMVAGSKTIVSDGIFSGIYVLNGEGNIDKDKLTQGDQLFVTAACKPFEIKGRLRLIRFYGPKGD